MIPQEQYIRPYSCENPDREIKLKFNMKPSFHTEYRNRLKENKYTCLSVFFCILETLIKFLRPTIVISYVIVYQLKKW